MKKLMYGLFVLVFMLSSALNSYAAITEPTSKNINPADLSAPSMNDVVVQDAMLEFKSLSRVEKKSRMAEVKQLAKQYKAQKATASEPSTNTILLAILAVILPPLAVYLHENEINGKFWLSLLLSLLFWLPGVIYALIVVLG